MTPLPRRSPEDSGPSETEWMSPEVHRMMSALAQMIADAVIVRLASSSPTLRRCDVEDETAPPSLDGWVSVEVAAQHLGTSARALRKRLQRAVRRAADGAVTAKIAGLEARQLGRSWRVHFPQGWRGK